MADLTILGIDSSAKSAAACVYSGEKVLAQAQLNVPLTHSQTLLPLIDGLLKNAKIQLSDIELFAVSSGPGSFTGLRISSAAVKGLAYSLNKPCIGVSSLESLAYNLLGFKGIVCAVMDARCSQVYTALFDASYGKTGFGISRISDDIAIPLSELEKMLKNYDKPVFFVGDGAELCYNTIGKNRDNVFLAPPHLRFQSGYGVCRCAESLKTSSVCAGELSLSYLRLPQAERELLKKTADKTADK